MVWALRPRYKYYTKKYRSRAVWLCSVNPPAGLPYHSPAWLSLSCRRCAAVSVVVVSGRAPPPRGVGPILPPPRVGFVIDRTLSGCALARLPRRRFRPPILVVVSPPLRCCVTSSASLCHLLCVVSSSAFPPSSSFPPSACLSFPLTASSSFLLPSSSFGWCRGLRRVEGRPWGCMCCRWAIRVVVGWFLLPHHRFLLSPPLCHPSPSLIWGLASSWWQNQRRQ